MVKRPYSSRRSAAIFAFFAFLFLPVLAFSQTVEDCDNGTDDDGDGLIDCFDPDCTCQGNCADFYYTTCNADCSYLPPCNQITLGVQWTAQVETGTYSPMVAGDMDGDGVPEIVTYHVENSEIYIVDGATGATKASIISPTVLPGGTAPAMADLDNDGFGEFILIGNDRFIRCYSHTGALKWTSPGIVGYDQRYRFAVPNIADFDHDGNPEINIGNQVFSGQNGALLAEGGPSVSAGEHPARVANGFSFCSPVAIDALPDNFCPDCDGLEIVAGNQVLSVDLVAGTVTPRVTAAAPFTDGFTSVADFDGDGDLDAIVQGKRGLQNYVYCWDIQTPTILRQFQLLNNWVEGASRVNIADLNGDGKLELSFVGYPRLYALRNDFSVMWIRQTNDLSSITCSSVFDFCGDGSADVIYRGMTFLQVLEGATGQIKYQDDCASETHIENPLVLDVDADGQTEIVIQCGGPTYGMGLPPYSGTIVAYEAVGSPGIASRRVWNQHAYFNTNINDDLSVPVYQQNPHIIGDSLRMNSFLNQYFNPTFPSPDGVLSFQNVVCVGDSLDVTLSLCNTGDNVLPPQTPISVYTANPQVTAAPWVGAAPLGFDLQKDSCRTFTIRIPRIANDSVFLVLNDDHSQAPPYNLSADFPVTAVGECKFTNNIVAFAYAYNPTVLDLGPDTLICDNATLALDAAGQDYVNWQWQDGSNGTSFTAPDAGTFAVAITDICGIVQTDTIVVGIDSNTVVQIGPDRVICQGETVALAENGFDFYSWTPANAVDCPSCPNVNAALPSSGTIALHASFANGCQSFDTLYLAVNDTFNYAIDTTVCYGRTVNWNGIDIAPDSVRSFFLQTLQGCDSTVTVRVHGTTVGTFQIQVDTAVCLGETLPYNGFNLLPGDQKTFYLSAITGCDSTVMVTVMPKDTFATAQSLTICNGESVPIFGQPQSSSGVYKMTFAAINGCDSTHTVNLNVLPALFLALDETPTCGGQTEGVVTAAGNGGTPPYSYAWNLPGQTGPSIDNLPAGTYSVTLTDASDCTKTASAQVVAYPPIEFEVTTDSVRCYGESNGAILITSADSTLLYALGDGGFSAATDYPNLASGPYDLQVQDVYGCLKDSTVTVPGPPELLVQLPGDTSIVLGEEILIEVFTNSTDSLALAWNTTEYLSCADCLTPLASPLSTVRYSLVATDANGCKAADEMLLEVRRVIDVFFPNAIAPTAPTDFNARFEPSFGPAVERVTSLRIFDRWGTLIHEAKNAAPGDFSLIWDGRYDGKVVMPGVYIWVIELELVDGAKEKFRGDVTVVR